jgi:anti-anti-sigma factor
MVVCVQFAASQVVLAVRGDLDDVSAPQLRAVSVAMVDGGHRRLVLDLAGCASIDAAGLRVMADTVELLDVWGGHRLIIRSPSTAVRRALDLSGLTDLTATDDPEPVTDVVGIPRAAPTTWAMPGRHEVAQHLSAAGLHGGGDDDDVDAALRLVVALAHAVVGGADGVSVSLRRHGQLSTVAASDQTILNMDSDQYATGEGPCVDASVQGRRFHAESMVNETRWPAFTPQALQLGINSILSSPLVVADRPIGALNIYSRTPDAFAAADQRLASLFADQASTVVAAGRAEISHDQVADRLDQALQTREIIAVAQGVLMERSTIDRDAAYTALRRSSVRTDQRLRDRAADVVASVGVGLPEPISSPDNFYG